jgi:hypothetical protein
MPTLDTINEQTTLLVNVKFYDEDDVLTAPESATYRIDAPGEVATVILGDTPIVPLTANVDLVITSAQNASVSSAPYQERVVTVSWRYASSRLGTDEYRYRIKALGGIS